MGSNRGGIAARARRRRRHRNEIGIQRAAVRKAGGTKPLKATKPKVAAKPKAAKAKAE